LIVLQETFSLYPIGLGGSLPGFDFTTAVSAANEGGISMAAPVAVCLFITTVVLALMTRAAPQMNLYSVGFPLRVLISLTALIVLLPQTLSSIVGQFSTFLELLKLRG
jgi:flagellar biosynthetic protein FliR